MERQLGLLTKIPFRADLHWNVRRWVWGLTPVVRLKRSRKAVGEPKPTWAPMRSTGCAVVSSILHRICRVYATIGIAVPVLGLATAGSLGVLGSPRLIASVVLTAGAAAVQALLVLPCQDGALAAVEAAADLAGAPIPGHQAAGRLAMLIGLFNLLWATVTVLMIIRPGSTTGA